MEILIAIVAAETLWICGQLLLIIHLVRKTPMEYPEGREPKAKRCWVCKGRHVVDPEFCQLMKAEQAVAEARQRDKANRYLSGQRRDGHSLLDRVCNDMDPMDQHTKKAKDQEDQEPNGN